MKEVDAEFLADTLRSITSQNEGAGQTELATHEGAMDKVIIQFRRTGIRFLIARAYTSPERWHFFSRLYFPPVARYLTALHHRFPNLDGEIDLWLDDVATGPGLGFTCDGSPGQIAMPDPFFLRSNGYQEFRELATQAPSWGERARIIYWRGVSTGYRSKQRPDWRDLPRFQLCIKAREIGSLVPMDAAITDIVQIGNPAEIEAIRASGLVGPRVPFKTFCEYRYGIDIDGNANSWPGLFGKLLTRITVLKVTSPNNFSQWYYPALEQWKHYVPVQSDMQDLLEKCLWLLDNDEEAENIANHGARFANAITVESTYAPLAEALRSRFRC